MIVKFNNKILIIITLFFISFSCNSSEPYKEGAHWEYSIICEGGFIYKNFGRDGGTILILNSDGTPLRCGKKRY